jgi:hypothetical protein
MEHYFYSNRNISSTFIPLLLYRIAMAYFCMEVKVVVLNTVEPVLKVSFASGELEH